MEKDQKTNIRPPIVTIMGHVDHGKTTLLDAIRKTNVVATEHGGITQHIGAYQITHHSQLITFIDTPGHAAFEKMRSRGVEVADIVVLVVAANDGVKPQTIEAIKHIQKAKKRVIVAITKTDLPNINVARLEKELQVQGIVVEALAGEVPVVEVAAPKNKGIADLLEVIQLVWQLSPAPNLPKAPLQAIVIESYLDKNRGAVVTIIVKQGTLSVGQKISVDSKTINIRALVDDQGQNIKQAHPSQPVEILGFKKVLAVGSIVSDLAETKTQTLESPATISDIIAKSQAARDKFKLIIKADVLGSLDAILGNLPDKVLVVSSGIGEISLSDVSLAKTVNAPILAFNLKIANSIKSQAENQGVVIRPYTVIYELLDDLADVVVGFEEAKHELKITGRGKIVASFNIEGKRIAGVKVTSGKLKIGDQVVLKSSNRQSEAKIDSLRKYKKDVEVVSSGQDCGIAFSPNLDFKEGDIIESLS